MATTEDILASAAKQLQGRWTDLDAKIAPLLGEQANLAQAIQRVTGKLPDGYTEAQRTIRKAGISNGAVKDAMQSGLWQSVAEIAAKLDTESAPVSRALKALVEDGSVLKQGERRGTRYSLA